VKRAIEIFEEKFDFFVKNIASMDVLFGSSFSKLEDVGKAFTRCGLTRYRFMELAVPYDRLLLANRFPSTAEQALSPIYPRTASSSIQQIHRNCIPAASWRRYQTVVWTKLSSGRLQLRAVFVFCGCSTKGLPLVSELLQ
jgi:hypothetical protein